MRRVWGGGRRRTEFSGCARLHTNAASLFTERSRLVLITTKTFGSPDEKKNAERSFKRDILWCMVDRMDT